MKEVLLAILASLRAGLQSRVALQLEVLALRHQLAVYRRSPTRARTKLADRLLWAWLSRKWAGWQDVLVFVQPRTVIAWQRRRFREHWARLSQGRPGRPTVAKAVQDLVRKMSSANPRWGSPRIVGELAKLGIRVAKSTVEKHMVRPKKPPSPTWRAFLDNHVKELVSVDFFVVPTVMFRVLFVFVVLVHERRRILHFNITEHPTAQWTAQQISEAFPWETAPRYLIRDRDGVYGTAFRTRVERMGIEEVLTAPRKSLAESLRRAGDREPPSRMPRPRRRPRRAALAEDPRRLPRALPSLALSPVAGHGLPGSSPCASARARGSGGSRGSWRPLPALRAARGLSSRPGTSDEPERKPEVHLRS